MVFLLSAGLSQKMGTTKIKEASFATCVYFGELYLENALSLRVPDAT